MKYLQVTPQLLASVNTNVKSCPTRELVATYGMPIHPSKLSQTCQMPEKGTYWARNMATVQVHDKWRATGHKVHMACLRDRLEVLKEKHPQVYAKLGHAGTLCCRYTRRAKVLSNHSLGMATDFTLQGILDKYGDGWYQAELLTLYSVLKVDEDGDPLYFWGIEFPTEDSMHFEMCSAALRKRGVL